MEKHGVLRSDLEHGRDLPGVRSLLSATAATAHAALREATRILREATRIVAELPE
ncbi:hypothetical protein [Streptomyces sp. NPDC051677]|uniref:hypothetical protein n=1 Tax=Streptomyces sp. NPDC051677 TaxID=3365669 RepID=UPI0037D32DDB